jgi:hypothetical protein
MKYAAGVFKLISEMDQAHSKIDLENVMLLYV